MPTMAKFASKTTVSSEKSKQEIERILTRYGAEEFLYGVRPDCAIVAFKMMGRNIRFNLPLPDRNSTEFTEYMRGSSCWERTPEAAGKMYEQAIRQKWRALALVIKAKLEAVESEITDFEDEFLAHIVLPGGQTMGQIAKPQIAIAYESGEMPTLLEHLT
jgi:hypothetical protein